MKAIFYLLIIFLISATQIKAGDNDYIPMIVPGNQCNELVTTETGGEPAYNIFTSIYKIGEDSIVNGITYKKVQGSAMLLREDINEKRVYRKDGLHPEYIAYDFSLKKGNILKTKMFYGGIFDELSDVDIYVIDIDSIEINLIYHKRYYISIRPSSDQNIEVEFHDRIWIEGIGCLNGFELSTVPSLMGSSQELLCFYQNNELVYKPKVNSLCYYSSSIIDTSYNAWNIFLSKNNILQIKPLFEYSDYFLRLIDLKGTILLSNNYNGDIEIELINIPKGQYLIEIQEGSNKMIKKIIIY